MRLKDYLRIEKALNIFFNKNPEAEKFRKGIIKSFCIQLKEDNPKFDATKFMSNNSVKGGNKLQCPNCKSFEIRRNIYQSDNIFGLSYSRWFEETGSYKCGKCGTFIKRAEQKI